MEEYRVINENKNYEISNLGNVRTIATGLILSGHKTNKGYCLVDLYKNNIRKNKTIHRLVAKAFIVNEHNAPNVDHINRIRSDNRIENLRWCTQSQNGMNKTKNTNNCSGHTGVSFDKSRNKWVASLSVKTMIIHKRFNTIEEAISYRSELEKIHFGVFAINNKN
jgi:hypothetical protein